MAGRYRDIIFLLGAGASAEAAIPTSAKMVAEIEHALKSDWRQFRQLYYHIKSGIYYSSGLREVFNDDVPYNIETLVNTLSELERNELHPLYPFIASMNPRLMSLSGKNFEEVHDFKQLILERLKKWMSPDDMRRKSSYYRGLRLFQQQINFPLQVFSLNYDLCVERLEVEGFRVETGFSGYGMDSPWDWERFEVERDAPEIYLYKLHGSIDWKRDGSSKRLFRVEQVAGVDPQDMELIFGREFKLTAADPYLFYLYAFRSATLSSRLIVSVGYGFGDSHINDMLSQALRAPEGSDRRLLVVANCQTEEERATQRRRISGLLQAEIDQIEVESGGAKSFFEDEALCSKLLTRVPVGAEAPF